MKKFIVLSFLIVLICSGYSQSVITTTHSINALANHNQRKLIRDNENFVHLFYEDIEGDTSVIMWMTANINNLSWSVPEAITYGKNASAAISNSGQIVLVYESLKNLRNILITQFINNSWTIPEVVLDNGHTQKLPVADFDSTGRLNIAWIEEINCGPDIIKFVSINQDSIETEMTITTDRDINDVCLAASLQYSSDLLFLSYCSRGNNITSMIYKPWKQQWDTLFTALGTQPAISVGEADPGYYENWLAPRFVYLDTLNKLQLIQFETFENNISAQFVFELVSNPVITVNIDDILSPFGFNFLYIKSNTLFHAFSNAFSPVEIIDTIDNNPFCPTIVYKQFNSDFVDFAWMKYNGTDYDICYKRSNKIPGAINPWGNKEIAISIQPNPTTKNQMVKIGITTSAFVIPMVKIYHISGKFVTQLKNTSHYSQTYDYSWNPENLEAGVYVVLVRLGEQQFCRKIVLIN